MSIICAAVLPAIAGSLFAAGTGELAPETGWYAAGSNLTVTAAAHEYSVFDRWEGSDTVSFRQQWRNLEFFNSHSRRAQGIRYIWEHFDLDVAVDDVACAVGFRSDDYLYRTFRRAFGITPSRYRIRKDSTAPNAD